MKHFDHNASPYHMPELGWAWGHPAVLAVMLLVVGGMFVFCRRRGWLRAACLAFAASPVSVSAQATREGEIADAIENTGKRIDIVGTKLAGRRALRRYLALFGYDHPAKFSGATKDDFLLVYGSLLRNEPGHRELNLHELQYHGVRRIEGSLYDLGDYPGFVHGSGTVLAELYRVPDPSVFLKLDAFEEYDRSKLEESLYRRTTVQVPAYRHSWLQKLLGSPMIDAWIYVYNQPLKAGIPLATESWAAHLKARKASAEVFQIASSRSAKDEDSTKECG